MVRGGPKRYWMTESQVRTFVKRVAGKDCDVHISFFTDLSPTSYGANIRVKKDGSHALLRVNRDLTRNPRVLLLHEMGHCFGEDAHNRSRVKRELSAQLWAISKAEQLGMTGVGRKLRWELTCKWPKYNWNSGYRRYVLASRMAKELI